MRKSPIRHKVRAHKREGKSIKSFMRGRGEKTTTTKRIVQHKPLTLRRIRIHNLTKIKTLQDSYIKQKIRQICKVAEKTGGVCSKNITLNLVKFNAKEAYEQYTYRPYGSKTVIFLPARGFTKDNIGDGLLSLGHEILESSYMIKNGQTRGKTKIWTVYHRRANVHHKDVFSAVITKDMIKYDEEEKEYYIGTKYLREMIPKEWVRKLN